jgi:N-acetylmuramic acid 6-phosphate etherase
LSTSIKETIENGYRIFIGGCGATGRLALACEVLWRSIHGNDEMGERVIGFMAGGDIALIKSIENFEDHPEFGARQLVELGFKNGDLLIACTEGGETPYVIGVTLKAASISDQPPIFLYCNPDDILRKTAQRSREIIDNEGIKKINLTVGPMALAGSTRMQASTVLMLAVGTALLHYNSRDCIENEIREFISFWHTTDLSFLKLYIEKESAIYSDYGFVFYEADQDLAITVLTDTTERAPTFSMYPFENSQDVATKQSLCYLSLPTASTSEEAWRTLLKRAPRTLEWADNNGVTSMYRLRGYDFSRQVINRRIKVLSPAKHYFFRIARPGGNLSFDFEKLHQHLPVKSLSILGIHLFLKMVLNTHSTLVMGRLGRYESNLMTWVRPSNNKLIDRTIRYVDLLLRRQGRQCSYETIAEACFEVMEKIKTDQSIVLAVVKKLLETA